MKKINLILPDYVAIFIVVFAIVACIVSSCTVKYVRFNNTSTEVKIDTVNLKIDNRGYYKSFGFIKLKYDGHSYLYIHELDNQHPMKNLIHDPNCECFKKYIQKEKSIYDY